MRRGENRLRFVGGPVRTPVKTECRWVERHRNHLGVSVESIAYYMNGDRAHRSVLIARPGEKLPVRVVLQGGPFRGEVAVDGLPKGWTAQPAAKPVAVERHSLWHPVELTVKAAAQSEGSIHSFDVVVREGEHVRRVPVQVLMATAPLVREAEKADRREGSTDTTGLLDLALPAELSGGFQVAVGSNGGRLTFDFEVTRPGKHALWLRARWRRESDTSMTLALDDARPRTLHPAARIGFSDWTSPAAAHTKMFAHFGEQFGHWSWYRVPDVELAPGEHRMTLGAGRGARFDALLLLPQNAAMDRAAMNLFQNWNFAPWDNPW